MNKKQLVAKLAGSLNQSKADAERTFDTITNTILDALKNDDSVKIFFCPFRSILRPLGLDHPVSETRGEVCAKKQPCRKMFFFFFLQLLAKAPRGPWGLWAP